MSLKNLASSSTDEGSAEGSRPRRFQDRIVKFFPVFLILGFAGIGWLLFGDLVLSGRPVETTTVVTRKTDLTPTNPGESPRQAATAEPADPFAGEVLFQASGWIEASPFPIHATALIDGVVDEVFVLEGEAVEKEQLLATLIDDDAQIAVREAEARVAEHRAALKREKERESGLIAQIETHRHEVSALEAGVAVLRDEAERLQSGGTKTFSDREVRQAELRLAAGEADLDALQSRGEELQAAWKVAKESIQVADARLKTAIATLEKAELQLSRTMIRSPLTGIVQTLYAEPGRKRMLGADDPDSATIAKIFNPDQLQARIDVPLEEAANLFIGQPVILRSNFLADREFRGWVERVEGMADIQRNTLQAKVSLIDPDSRLRPEMLCRAEFLRSAQAGSPAAQGRNTASQRVQVFVPVEALADPTRSETVVWTLDPTGERAERRAIRVKNESTDAGLIEVIEGLNPGDPVILNPPDDLTTGERVQPSPTDES